MNQKEPVIKQGWLRVLLFCIAYFVFQMVAGVTLGLIAMLVTKAGGLADAMQLLMQNNSLSILIIVGFNFISSLLLVFLFRKFIDRKSIYSLGWDFGNYKIHAMVGFLAGIATLGLGTFILIALKNLHFTGWNVDGKEIIFSFGIMVFVAIAEELMFRGYILNNLLQSTNKYTALLISALLFAIAHNANPNFSWLSFLNIFLAGLFLGINYIYTQNLWYAVMLHFSWNFFQGPVLGYDVSGLKFESIFIQETSGNPLITGGAFGFEGSVIASVVMVLFTVVLWMAYERKVRKVQEVSKV
jgi:uncharacterized protein